MTGCFLGRPRKCFAAREAAAFFFLSGFADLRRFAFWAEVLRDFARLEVFDFFVKASGS
jgi:hypothetical protein